MFEQAKSFAQAILAKSQKYKRYETPGLVGLTVVAAVALQYHVYQRCKRSFESQIDAAVAAIANAELATRVAQQQAVDLQRVIDSLTTANDHAQAELRAEIAVEKASNEAMATRLQTLQTGASGLVSKAAGRIDALEKQLVEQAAEHNTAMANIQAKEKSFLDQVEASTKENQRLETALKNTIERETALKKQVKEWKKLEQEWEAWKADPPKVATKDRAISADSFHAVHDRNQRVLSVSSTRNLLVNPLVRDDVEAIPSNRPKNALRLDAPVQSATSANMRPTTVKFSDIRIRGEQRRFEGPKDWEKISRPADPSRVRHAVEIRKRYQRFLNENRSLANKLSENYIIHEGIFWANKCRIPIDWDDMDVPQSIVDAMEKDREAYMQRKLIQRTTRDGVPAQQPSEKAKGKRRAEPKHDNGVDSHLASACPVNTLDDVLDRPPTRPLVGRGGFRGASARGRGGNTGGQLGDRTTAVVALGILQRANERKAKADEAERKRIEIAEANRLDREAAANGSWDQDILTPGTPEAPLMLQQLVQLGYEPTDDAWADEVSRMNTPNSTRPASPASSLSDDAFDSAPEADA